MRNLLYASNLSTQPQTKYFARNEYLSCSSYSFAFWVNIKHISIGFSFLFFSVYGTLPNTYKTQPGKIENFTPGHSSATDRERREVCISFLSEFQNKIK